MTQLDRGLPDAFELELGDDAMRPRPGEGAGTGDVVRFRRSTTATFGDAVLVRVPDGSVHFRLYRQGPAQTWEAAALNPAFHTFKATDGPLTVLAVFTGMVREGSWTQVAMH